MKQNTTIFRTNSIDEVIDIAFDDVRFVGKRQAGETIYYANCPCAFDIETSSFYEAGEKRGCMYGWTMDLNGCVVLGRTWAEWLECLDRLSEHLNLWDTRRLLIYVHNLAFEFQWFANWFNWQKVFAIDERKPVYALTDSGIEFRCSYILTDYKLETIGENLKKYPVRKMVGDLDYSLIRHPETPLTDKEIGYMVNDVRVVTHYIQEQIDIEKNITRIPLTKTGYVRRFCRKECLTDTKDDPFRRYRYQRKVKFLTLQPEEYKMLRRAFMGGFTHANAMWANRTLEDVVSYDIASSYPAVMVAENRFPMGKGEEVKVKSKKEFLSNLRKYWCLFDVQFNNIESSQLSDHILSLSKCWNVVNADVDNGRIIRADSLRTTLTGEDFEMIDKFYTFDRPKIGKFWRYRRGYLPTEFVKAILELYKAKTELKGVAGREEEYQNAKERINACYGMCVTDIVRDEHLYLDHWLDEAEWKEQRQMTDDEYLLKKLEKENRSSKRFLFYAWGIAVVSFARKNLFRAILECDEDYVYADTDSVKFLNREKHQAYFDRYNAEMIEKLKKAMDYHGLPYDYIIPKTVKDIEKPLGAWEYEGTYKFRTIGAKRYCCEKDGKFSITVSGVNKKVAVPYLLDKYGDKVFDNFTDGLYIPPEYTGKSTHTYIDEPTAGEVTDYLGNKGRYYERSSLHLEASEYSLDATKYVEYLMGIKEIKK